MMLLYKYVKNYFKKIGDTCNLSKQSQASLHNAKAFVHMRNWTWTEPQLHSTHLEIFDPQPFCLC